MRTPIRVDAAKAALNQYLDDAGITRPLDRYNALQRQNARLWLQQLQSATLADGLDVFDIIAGREALLDELIWEIPTGAGKSHPAMLEVQP